MCSKCLSIVMAVLLAVSCTHYRNLRQIQDSNLRLGLSVPEALPEQPAMDDSLAYDATISVDDGPIIMNAIKDTETGEMVATDIIRASSVTARFRNVAERGGYVTIGFDVTVPEQMSASRWKLRIDPLMQISKDTVLLEPIFITGTRYRKGQMRGYERYQAFIESIITDPSVFIDKRQLEIFLKRHFPQTYAMKADTSFITEPQEENLFGVRQQDALEHYTYRLMLLRNEKRKKNADKAYRRFVKDPIIKEGVRLDTVLSSVGIFTYRYSHTFKSIPGLRKTIVTLIGNLYEKGEKIASVPMSDSLTFYVSSMSALCDDKVRYRTIIKERRVNDNTRAFVDFAQGSALSQNASELRRIRKCISDVASHGDLVLDSLVVHASSSLEGDAGFNRRLSESRSRAICRYLEGYVPAEWKDSLRSSSMSENWDRFRLLIQNDTVLSADVRKRILKIADYNGDPDCAEGRLSRLPQYRYLREKIYPKLRTVSFNIYLHRAGMVKDTVWTSEIDTIYMSGLAALKDLDYNRAVTLLRSYKDYNAALALASAGYNHTSLDILSNLEESNPKVCYLKAVLLSRIERYSDALSAFRKAVELDPAMVHRANLDPEMTVVRQKFNQLK